MTPEPLVSGIVLKTGLNEHNMKAQCENTDLVRRRFADGVGHQHRSVLPLHQGPVHSVEGRWHPLPNSDVNITERWKGRKGKLRKRMTRMP